MEYSTTLDGPAVGTDLSDGTWIPTWQWLTVGAVSLADYGLRPNLLFSLDRIEPTN